MKMEEPILTTMSTLQYPRVVEFSDGVALVEGLTGAKIGQKIILPDSSERTDTKYEIFGQIMDIEENYNGEVYARCIIFGEERFVKEGDLVKIADEDKNEPVWQDNVLSVEVSEETLGKVVDPFGRFISIEDKDGNFEPKVFSNENTTKVAIEKRPIEVEAPQMSFRAPVEKQLLTGVKVIDTILPIGFGQRMLFIGDRGTGKTTLALTIFKNQAIINKDIILIYAAIGKKITEVKKIVNLLQYEFKCLDRTIIVLSKANDPAGLVYITPYSATSIAEYFRDKGKDVIIVYDDLTSHADSYRHISLLLRRPPGREAYPGDIFYIHSRLLERASNIYLKNRDGGYYHCSVKENPTKTASITAIPIVRTKESDYTAYIPTNIISITDGQIYFDSDLANNNIFPPINVGLSVSRIGSRLLSYPLKIVSKDLRADLAIYKEKEKYSNFEFELDEKDKLFMELGSDLISFCKQDEFEIKTEEDMIDSLVEKYLIFVLKDLGKNDYLKFIDVIKLKFFTFIKKFQRSVTSFAQLSFKSILKKFIEQLEIENEILK